MLIRTLVALSLLTLSISALADQVQVAVASNFTPTLRLLATAFASQTGHRLRISSASTGKLYAQITHGAPFDLFLAADAARPERLEQAGHTVDGSRFTYAQGRLVLWGPKINSSQPVETLLQSSGIGHIAIANPTTAPYGTATREVLRSMSLWEGLKGRLVRGENVGQAYQYVASGAADLGFVAYSQLLSGQHQDGYLWSIPQDHFQPIRQQAVLLKRAENKPAAHLFLEYLRSPAARKIIVEQGYSIESPQN